jgi:hypothetical protein
MKFRYKDTCECGGEIVFLATGEEEFGPGECFSSCKTTAYLSDALSVSVTAERLLYRSKAELEDGDYSLSIVIATIAVESYLTRLFLKLKGMENYATTFELPNKSMEAQWEKEYPRSGGFLKPSNFVAKRFTGLTFDQFVMSNNIIAAHAFLGLPNTNEVPPSRYFQDELFNRRNRIAHWGYVNSTRQEAERSHQIAVAIITILREMDRLKYGPS